MDKETSWIQRSATCRKRWIARRDAASKQKIWKTTICYEQICLESIISKAELLSKINEHDGRFLKRDQGNQSHCADKPINVNKNSFVILQYHCSLNLNRIFLKFIYSFHWRNEEDVCKNAWNRQSLLNRRTSFFWTQQSQN